MICAKTILICTNNFVTSKTQTHPVDKLQYVYIFDTTQAKHRIINDANFELVHEESNASLNVCNQISKSDLFSHTQSHLSSTACCRIIIKTLIAANF